MGRGGKLGRKQTIKRKVQSKNNKGSDESDEEYTVGEDEVFEESEEDCSSYAEDESEEILGEFEEEDEEEEEVVKKVVKTKWRKRKGSSGRKRTRVEKLRSRKRVQYEGDDDEGYDDDEEFMPDEIDCLDDEDELVVKKKKNRKIGRSSLQEKGIPKGPKRKRKRNKKSKVVGKPMRKKPKKNPRLGRKSAAGIHGSQRNSGQRRKLMVHSDSDLVSSDFVYTLSEEEREQVREASEFCRSLTTNLRSSSKILDEEGLSSQQGKRRKGKEKVDDLKKEEVGKLVCGICFTEEEKKTLRGTLNCCSHYFCFACIMEWSKVESRCPLCKQRFTTISKPARSITGFDLRTSVIQVPERDQVYQPSEEEFMGYLDPYESVICTECQQGGDDAFMLLCDLCDSSAHTYCMGLGSEVPEGNWYCEGCKPIALGSTTPQAPNPSPNQSTSTNLVGGSSPIINVRESLDLNAMYIPDTPLTQENGFFSSPRRPIGDFQAVSSVSRGGGAFTVGERRRIQRQIQHLLNNRTNIMGDRTVSGNDFFGSQIDFERELVNHRPSYTSPEGRLQENVTHVMQNRDLFSGRLSHSRGQVIQGPTSTSSDTLRAQFSGINSRSLRPCSSRSSLGSENSMSPYMYRELSHFPQEKEQVQSMVRSHLKSLSRDAELGYNAFKDIARSSTHTILAVCGLEHRRSEVCLLKPPSVCNHVEQMAVAQMSLMKGHCSPCFDSFVGSVVHEIMNRRVHPWFRG